MGLIGAVSHKVFISMGRKIRSQVYEQSTDPRAAQEAVLLDHIRACENSEFGRAHHFSEIHSAADFAERVPLSNYGDYASAIERMRAGEKDLLTCYETSSFSTTSGSVGVPKHIPQSKREMSRLTGFMMGYPYSVIDEYLRSKGERMSSTPGFSFIEAKLTFDEQGRPTGSGSSMAMYSMRHILKYLYATPPETIFKKDGTDGAYINARFMLTNPNLSFLMSTFSTMILYTFLFMQRNVDMLVEDIRTGTIDESIEMPESVRTSLMARIKPMPERADEIARVFARCETEPVAPKLWPHMQYVLTVGTGGFAKHTEMLRRFTGDIPFYLSILTASEGFFGPSDGMEQPYFLLATNAEYYEFIPLENAYDENPPVLDVSQVKDGEEYETVVTNYSGFYRYRMGDVVRIHGFHNKTPYLEFRYRLGQVLSMAAEKTNMDHVKWSVDELTRQTGLNIVEFAVQPLTDVYPNRYKVFLEATESTYDRPLSAYASILEEALEKANPSYGAKVQKGMFAPLELVFNQPQTHILYREMMATKNHVSESQIKPVNLIDNPIKEKFFGALLDELPEG